MKSKFLALGLLGAGSVTAFAGGGGYTAPAVPQLTVCAYLCDPTCCRQYCCIQLPVDRLITDAANDGLGNANSLTYGGVAEVDPDQVPVWNWLLNQTKCGYGVKIVIQGSGQSPATYPAVPNGIYTTPFGSPAVNVQSMESNCWEQDLYCVTGIEIVTGDSHWRGGWRHGRQYGWRACFKP